MQSVGRHLQRQKLEPYTHALKDALPSGQLYLQLAGNRVRIAAWLAAAAQTPLPRCRRHCRPEPATSGPPPAADARPCCP